MKCIIDNCDNERIKNRRYCDYHYKEIKRKQSYNRYHSDSFQRTKYPCVCKFCNKEFNGFTREQLFCSKSCYFEFSKINSHNATNNYENAHGYSYCWMHRRIAEKLLNRKLSSDDVIHHIDCNPKNNDIKNLIILNRSQHIKLHLFLNDKKFELIKNNDNNVNDFWEENINILTKKWIEVNNKNVIQLSMF